MTLGSSIQTQIDTLLSDPNLRSTLSIKRVTRTVGARGGYDSSSESVTSTTDIYGVPSNFIKTRAGLEKHGDIQEGEIRFLIRPAQGIDTNDLITFQSEEYHVRSIKDIFFNEVIIAKSVILSKVQ